MNISLHIERLILDGIAVPPGEGPRLQAAVEAELGRLLAEGGLSPALLGGGAVPLLRASEVQLVNDGTPGRLGTQIARSVYQGIGKE
jgi:hypothetical protein